MPTMQATQSARRASRCSTDLIPGKKNPFKNTYEVSIFSFYPSVFISYGIVRISAQQPVQHDPDIFILEGAALVEY